MNKSWLLVLIFLLSVGIVFSDPSDCMTTYGGVGDWNIATAISCNDEVLDIAGNLNILNTTEVAVTSFDDSESGAYDASGNSTILTMEIPDVNSATPTDRKSVV